MPSLTLSPTSLEDAMLTNMDPADIADHIAIMRVQEETTYKVADYLAESVQIRKAAAKPVDADCRVKMCEWCYQVVDFCKFRRETVAIGMSYLDRYLCLPEGRSALCNRKEYQLAAMTALYIAIKMHEPLEMETSLLADLSRGCYGEMEFVHMEEKMLLALQWRVNGPTALGFVQHFIALMPSSLGGVVSEAIMDYARYQIELAISDHKFVSTKSSELALAAIMNSIEGMDVELVPTKLQGKFLRRVEKIANLMVDDVHTTQTELSMLLVDVVANEVEISTESEEEEDEDEEELLAEEDGEFAGEDKFKPGNINRRNSPVSVTRR